MDEYEWYDDEPYSEPYVIVERHEAGVGPLILGLALGAGVALLLAPQSGEATRRSIARRARRAQEAAQEIVEDMSGVVAEKFHDVRDRVEDSIDATLDAVDAKKRQVADAFDAGRAAARQSRGELEHRIAERKAAYKDA
ncbi:MAG: YtxH domain-containing protein [Gemmatimonadota bacterium]|nr:YtxH domain-containing protein [Gemmatimonadota bacterium]